MCSRREDTLYGFIDRYILYTLGWLIRIDLRENVIIIYNLFHFQSITHVTNKHCISCVIHTSEKGGKGIKNNSLNALWNIHIEKKIAAKIGYK